MRISTGINVVHLRCWILLKVQIQNFCIELNRIYLDDRLFSLGRGVVSRSLCTMLLMRVVL